MKVLLDTHAFLWAITDDVRLSASAQRTFEEADPVLSVASIWEVVIKHQIGRLMLPAQPSLYLPAQLARNGIEVLPIEARHVLRLESMPLHHRDPFDRILAAQALEDGLPILTADPLLAPYGVTILW